MVIGGSILCVENRCIILNLLKDSNISLLTPLIDILQSNRILKFCNDAPQLVANLFNHCKISVSNVLDLHPEIEHRNLIAPLLNNNYLLPLAIEKSSNIEQTLSPSAVQESYLNSLLRYITRDTTIFYEEKKDTEYIPCQKAFLLYCFGLLATDALPLVCLADLKQHQRNALLLSPDTFIWPLTTSSLLLEHSMLDRSRYGVAQLLKSLGIPDEVLSPYRYPALLSTMISAISDKALRSGQSPLVALNSVLSNMLTPMHIADNEQCDSPKSPVITSSFAIQVSPPISANFRSQEIMQALSAKRFVDSAPNSARYHTGVFGGESLHPNTAYPNSATVSKSNGENVAIAAAMISSRLQSYALSQNIPLSSSPHPSKMQNRMESHSQPHTPIERNIYGHGVNHVNHSPSLVTSSVWGPNSDMPMSASSSLLSSLLMGSTASAPSSAKIPSISSKPTPPLQGYPAPGGLGLSKFSSPAFPSTSAFPPSQFSLFSPMDFKADTTWNRLPSSVKSLGSLPPGINQPHSARSLNYSSNLNTKPAVIEAHKDNMSSAMNEQDDVYIDNGWNNKIVSNTFSPVLSNLEDAGNNSPVVSPVTSPTTSPRKFTSNPESSTLFSSTLPQSSNNNMNAYSIYSSLNSSTLFPPNNQSISNPIFSTDLHAESQPFDPNFGGSNYNNTSNTESQFNENSLGAFNNDGSSNSINDSKNMSFASLAAKIKQPNHVPLSNSGPSPTISNTTTTTNTSSILVAAPKKLSSGSIGATSESITSNVDSPTNIPTPKPRDVTKVSDFDKILFKTAMCKRFTETGNCNYDDKCGFAHGESELRKLSANERANLAAVSRKEKDPSPEKKKDRKISVNTLVNMMDNATGEISNNVSPANAADKFDKKKPSVVSNVKKDPIKPK